MVTGKTKSGFEFQIPDGLMTDWRYVKALRDVRSKDPEKQIDGLCDMISVMFNDEAQEEAFYKHIGERYNGRVESETLWEEVNEILTAVNENSKNS